MKPTTASIHIAKSLQADPQSKTWQQRMAAPTHDKIYQQTNDRKRSTIT